jgi:hypothetical protein
MMEEIVLRVVKTTGIEKGIAQKTISIIFELLRDNCPQDKVQQLIDKLPGIEISASETPSGGGLFSRGAVLGGAMGAMGALGKLTSTGLTMGDVKKIGVEVLGYSREQAGDELVDEIVSSIPGLSQFI